MVSTENWKTTWCGTRPQSDVKSREKVLVLMQVVLKYVHKFFESSCFKRQSLSKYSLLECRLQLATSCCSCGVAEGILCAIWG
jgi:hypothetical protein